MKATGLSAMRRGAILIWAMITLAVVTTLVGAVGSYNMNAMRMGREYLLANSEYYSFLYIKGQVANDVDLAMKEANAADEGQSLGVLMSNLKKLEKDYWDGDHHVVVKVKGFDTLESDLSSKSEGKLTIEMTVYRKGVGGIEIVAKQFEQDLVLTFMLNGGAGGGLALHPIFNYCYFANNYGHLGITGGAKIIVNGDIGSNDRFTIDGATVNGYIWAHAQAKGQNAVELKNSPHIWPYPTYQKRVVREYQDNGKEYFTPVRPTDPILCKDKFVEWSGGYQAPGVPNEYIAIGTDGSVSYTYPGDAFDPGEFTETAPPQPGTYPTSMAMPLPNDANHKTALRLSFKEDSYQRDLKNWLKMDWFAGRYSSLYNLPNFPVLKNYYKLSWSTQLSNYDAAVRSWATSKGVDLNGAPSASAIQAWNDTNTAYTNYLARAAAHAEKKQKFQTAKANFLANLQSQIPEEGEILTLTTQHKDPSSDVVTDIISSSTNVVAMPNVSDAANYRLKCLNYTNSLGQTSRLICENRYVAPDGTEHNIAWERTAYDRTLWTKSEVGLGLSEYQVGDVLKTETNRSDVVTLTRTLAKVVVDHGYAQEIYPFESRTASGENEYLGSDAYYKTGANKEFVKQAECGSVILLGTLNHPIVIDGPVYFDGDVIIRGFVTGQGTIYAGRNIHIIGDITSLNPPHWPHSTPSLDKCTPDEVRASNLTKDSLTLVARGNIIVGNYSDSDWMNSCKDWMRKGVTDSNYHSSVPCCTDYDDDEIGYSAFAYDYTARENAAKDENAMIAWEYAEDPYSVDVPEDGNMFDTKYLKYIGDYMVQIYVCDKKKYRLEPYRTTHSRRFYESKLGSEVINDLMQQSVSAKLVGVSSTGLLNWLWSSSVVLRWLFRNVLGGALLQQNVDYNNVSFDVTQVTKAVAGDANAGDITQIDAILFANHGIFGRVGGSSSHKFKLHGGMICRDEGLLPSFAVRFKSDSGAAAWVNWDMRIKGDSAEGIVGTGGPGMGRKSIKVKTKTSWRQTK